MRKVSLFITFLAIIGLLGGCGEDTTSLLSNSTASNNNSTSNSSETMYDFNPSNQKIETVYENNSGIFYEIFVYSFYDSNNDGIGDLNGVKEKLPYLKELGINGIWLTPIMPSNSYHKYDVIDYYNIDEDFGTIADFESLVSDASKLGIDIIIDLVLNHTSTSNQWFIDSLQAQINNDIYSPYFDYYNWSNEPLTGYTESSHKGLYYESQFDSSMPDLNLDNENVRKEIKDIIHFWMNKGIKGFRLDATTYYYQSANKNIDMLTYIRDCTKEVRKDCYIVGEAWSGEGTIEEYSKSGNSFFAFQYSQGNNPSFAYSINTKNLTNVNKGLVEFTKVVRTNNPESNTAFFVANHDMDRTGRYFSGRPYEDQYLKVLASLYLLTPGNPFIYYGEEIALAGTRGTNNTDANRRLHMIWGGSEKDNETIDPPGANYDSNLQVKLGVNDLKDDITSLTYHYKKIINLRNKYADIFLYGDVSYVKISSVLFGLEFSYEGKDIILLTNIYEKGLNLKLSTYIEDYDKYALTDEVQIINEQSSYDLDYLKIMPFSTIIITKTI